MILKTLKASVLVTILFCLVSTSVILGICHSPAIAGVSSDLNLGVAYYYQEQFHEAQTVFEAVLAEDPGNFQAHFNLYLTLVALDRPEQAQVHLEQCLRIDPEYPGLQLELGNILFDRGHLGEAVVAYELELKNDPSNLAAVYNLAMVEITQSSFAAAAEKLSLIVQRDPEFPGAKLALGEVFAQLHDWERALSALNEARAEEPENARLYLLLGVAQQNLGDPTRAGTHYQHAL